MAGALLLGLPLPLTAVKTLYVNLPPMDCRPWLSPWTRPRRTSCAVLRAMPHGLHAPFGTFSLTGADWIVIASASFSVFPVLEFAK